MSANSARDKRGKGPRSMKKAKRKKMWEIAERDKRLREEKKRREHPELFKDEMDEKRRSWEMQYGEYMDDNWKK